MLDNDVFINKIANLGMKLQIKLETGDNIDTQLEYKTFKDDILKLARHESTRKACATGTMVVQKKKKTGQHSQ